MPDKKRPEDMTTREAVRHLFPKQLADALEEAVHEPSEETDPTPERRKRTTKKAR